jgi:hypothetical protein
MKDLSNQEEIYSVFITKTFKKSQTKEKAKKQKRSFMNPITKEPNTT